MMAQIKIEILPSVVSYPGFLLSAIEWLNLATSIMAVTPEIVRRPISTQADTSTELILPGGVRRLCAVLGVCRTWEEIILAKRP